MKIRKQKKLTKSRPACRSFSEGRAGAAREKRDYQKPLLKKYGSIAEITGCADGALTDAFFAGSLVCGL